jgi:ubiquinone/menaquinone biosynthesis C-methylase UbiE
MEKENTTARRHEGSEKPGLIKRNFRKVAPNGLEDPLNSYPHSMAWHQDYLYVGTSRANLANRGTQIARKTPERIGEIWPVKIPRNGYDNDLRAQIWRYHPPTDRWSKVFTSPMVKGTDGSTIPQSIGFRSMISFQGLSDSEPALYVPTWGTYFYPYSFMLRSGDGVNFDVVSEPGRCIPYEQIWGLRGLVAFKGRLFASPAAGRARHEPNAAGFTGVLVSEDPARGDWKLACKPNFGDPNNFSVFQVGAFNGYLYAGTLNIHEGYQVWKTDAEGEPPFKWKKVLSHGAYRGKFNQIAMTLVPFKDCLYVGSGIQNGGFDFDNNIGPAAPELVCIHRDDSWELVFGEPRITPDGFKLPLSGIGPGFGNPFAGYIWSMAVYEGWLYVGNAVWIIFLRYSGKEDRWPDHLRSMFTKENVERMLLNFGGCDLWRTRDGYHWVPVTQNGFENCFNLGFRNMVASPHGLFVGASNPFAPEVAVRRLAGWNYEENARGGLEIWCGSHDYHGPVPSRDVREKSLPRLELGGEDPVSEEEKIRKEINDFYDESGFRHYGYWRVDINDARGACENLMDEILAFIPDKKGTILDIGCGLGATTRHLLKHFPPDAVTGITQDKKLLEACREKNTGIQFISRKLKDLKLPAKSFDSVIWVKGMHRLGSRRALLRQSFQALKPGGRLVCFDIVQQGTGVTGIWNNIFNIDGSVKSLDEYRKLLSQSEFVDVRVFDITDRSGDSFRRHVDRYFDLKKMSGEIDDDMQRRLQESLSSEKLKAGRCLLISAKRQA